MNRLLILGSLAGPLAAPLSADFITGRVVDVHGNGVAGVDIDVENLGSGGDPEIFNDGTDANGLFTTTVPAGVYAVFFKPPPPPTTTHLTETVSSVVVIGVTDMGVITLPPGVGLTGRVVDTNGFPVANVNLDVTDLTTGQGLILKNGRTDLFGNFGVAVPAGPVHLDFDPGALAVPVLVPQRLALSPSADAVLGDLVFPPGFRLSGTLTNSIGQPLPGIDLDVFDSAGGEKVFTPRDNTNLLGNFSIVLEAGLYDVEICPNPSTLLVGLDQEGVSFSGDLSLGTLALAHGVVLSGIVRDAAGTPLTGIDLDLMDSLTGASIVTCGDDTNTMGFYSVIAPTGVLDIGFAPPGRHGTTAEDLYTSVPITTSTMLDGTIPAPMAAFAATSPSGTVPLLVAFQDLSMGAVSSWSWSFGDGGSSIVASPTHVYATPGSYTVALTADGIGGPSTYTEVVQVLLFPPVASFDATRRTGTAPVTVVFSDSSTGDPGSWSWDFGDGSLSSAQNPVHTYVRPGTYDVSLTVANGVGSNTLTLPAFVTVEDGSVRVPGLPGGGGGRSLPPQPSFTAEPRTGKAPLTVLFADTSSGGATSRLWEFGDGTTSTSSSPVHVYDRPGEYDVRLTLTNPTGSRRVTRTSFIVVLAPSVRASGSPRNGGSVNAPR